MAVDKFISIATPVAQEVAVDLAVVAVLYPSQRAVTFTGNGVAAHTAMDANGRSGLQIPLPCVVFLQGLVRENTGGADLHKVAAEFTLEYAVLVAAEIYGVVRSEDIKVASPGVIPVEADAPVALDAAVHLVVHEGPQILIHVGPLTEAKPAVDMPCHDRHVLEVAFTPLVAYRAVMRMIRHEPLDVARAEFSRLGIINGQACSLGRGCHAGHHYPAMPVCFVPEYLNGALPAGPHRMHGRMPAEIGDVEAE